MNHPNEKDKEGAAKMVADRWGSIAIALYCVKAAIELGIPNILGNGGAMTAEEIAKPIPTTTGAPANALNLERILRCLAANDVVEESVLEKEGKSERRYTAAAALKLLIDEESRGSSLGASLLYQLDVSNVQVMENFHLAVVGNAEDPTQLALGKSFYDFVNERPGFKSKFHRAMAGLSNPYTGRLLESYAGLKDVKTLVDVGGGVGVIIAAIVSKHPHIKGILFDQLEVISAAPDLPGVEKVGGNFFESIPECDAVFMKSILHNWNDDNCVKILKTIAKALPEEGKVINLDVVVAENCSIGSLHLDVLMMMISSGGGKERTLTEFRELGRQAGFPRVEFVVTLGEYSVVEFYKK